MIGTYCIARCRADGAGVHYGIVLECVGNRVRLGAGDGCKGARRLWAWTDHFTLHGVALHGPGREARLSEALPWVYLSEVCELLPVTEEARLLLEDGP